MAGCRVRPRIVRECYNTDVSEWYRRLNIAGNDRPIEVVTKIEIGRVPVIFQSHVNTQSSIKSKNTSYHSDPVGETRVHVPARE